MDTDRDNRLVPSRLADDAEFAALVGVLARHAAPRSSTSPASASPSSSPTSSGWSTLTRVRGRAAARRRLPAGGERGRARATSSRPSSRRTGRRRAAVGELQRAAVAREHALRALDHVERRAGVARARQRPPDDQRAWLADPVVARPGPARVGRVHVHARADQGARAAPARSGGAHRRRVARRRDGPHRPHPSDALADWLLATDLTGHIRTVAPSDRRRPPPSTSSAQPFTLSGASDAGAHVQMFSGAGDSTYLLAHLVRDVGSVSVEEAVHARHRQAGAVLRHPRPRRRAPGRGRPTSSCSRSTSSSPATRCARTDLPGDAWRYGRTPGGYRATIVAGEPTWLDGAATGARPGTMLERG